MPLSKNVNSYVTVAEADTYFETRIDIAAWADASENQKAAALVTATQLLDELKWDGMVVSVDQSLAFPRIGCYFDPRLGCHANMDPVPKRITVATYELAYHLLNNDGLLDDTGRVETLSLGPINLQKIEIAKKIPSVVKRMINPLLVNRGQNSWWRAN